MSGMAPFVPTPKSDKFKAGDWVEVALSPSVTQVGQLWSRSENPISQPGSRWTSPTRKQGKFWFVVYPNRTWSCVSERSLTLVQSRDEQLELSA